MLALPSVPFNPGSGGGGGGGGGGGENEAAKVVHLGFLSTIYVHICLHRPGNETGRLSDRLTLYH